MLLPFFLGDGNIDYKEFVRVGEMKSELAEQQQQAQAANQALAQQLTSISQARRRLSPLHARVMGGTRCLTDVIYAAGKV